MPSEFAPLDLGLTDYLELNARHRAPRPALIEGDRILTWGQFGQAVDGAALNLIERGLRPGEIVALISRTGIDAVILQFGIARAGGVIASMSTAVTEDALGGMIKDADARFVIADDETARRIALYLGEAVLIPVDSPPPAPASRIAGLPQIDGLAAMNIMYSSGTTGSPKGIVLSHRARKNWALAMTIGYGIDEESVLLATTALCSNMTWTLLICMLLTGSTAVLMSKFDAGAFCDLADRHGATHTIMVPTQYQRILDHPASQTARLDSFKAACTVGSAMSPAMKARVAARFPGAFHECYGMTEGFATMMRPLDVAAKAGAVGRPLPGNDIRIIDEDDLEVAAGMSGEIVGRSPLLMSHYHNKPDQTAAAIWTDPVSGLAFIRSGDLGLMDEDGFVHLVDRKKDMIISGGQNVFPADLEKVLSDHPGVAEVAVIAIPHADWGETPLALVVATQALTLSAEQLRDWANAKLGRHQRISAIEFRDSLPRNDGGKAVKAQLRAPYWTSQTA